MSAVVNSIFQEALHLTVLDRASLAEKLVESLETDIPEEIEASHLAIVRRRIDEISAGGVTLLDGESVMARMRAKLS
jgi:putative addiction module component (TIGR02574 family)